MATLSSFFTATIYAQQANYDAKQGGWQFPSLFLNPSYQALPKSGFIFKTISPSQVVTNALGVSVTLNTIIEQIPSGVLGGFTPSRFVTDSTLAQLYTNGA